METKKLNTLTFFEPEKETFHVELHDALDGCFSEDLSKEQVVELVEFLSKYLK